jgi:hypothetical protein
VADIDGARGEEVVAGTSSMDLQASSANGGPASARWPKLTGDWTVSTPAIGSLGTLDTDPAARKVVVAMTRNGAVSAYATDAPACSPGSWPRFHHDLANSGDATRDAVAPGRPSGATVSDGRITFTAPGDDLLCGRAARYEVLRSTHRITGREHGWRTVTGVTPAAAGTADAVALPAGRGAYVAVRAVDDAGSRSRPAVVRARG